MPFAYLRSMTRFVVYLLLAVFVLGLPSFRGNPLADSRPGTVNRQTARSLAHAAGASGQSEGFESLKTKGITALYNLDFGTARDCFQKMAALAPERPESYVYLASASLVETLNKSRRLSTSLYAGGSFYTLGSSGDTTDAGAAQQFNGYVDQALTACSNLLKKNPQDANALYFQASALGLRAAYIAMVQRSFRKAFDDANDSVNIDKKVLKLDPSRSDAYLYIGLYEYVIGCLPFLWRLLARLAGLPGSRDRGIQELENVVASGKEASDDARVLLLAIYYREGKPDRALAEAESLSAKYPGNYLFGAERGAMLYACWKPADGYFAFKQLLEQPRVAAEARDIVNYRWAQALQNARDCAGALERYKQVIEWSWSQYDLVTQSYLHAGEMLDCLNRREEAIADYQAVLSRRNIYDCQDQAREHIKHPYRIR